MNTQHMEQINHPLTLFLIGATGDLAKKKILKAVWNLYTKHLLPESFTLIGNARSDRSHDDFREFVRGLVNAGDTPDWDRFAQHIYFVPGDAADPETFSALQNFHKTLQTTHACGNHLWYLATLPSLYSTIVKNLKKLQLSETSCGWTKIMIEKPFGTDYRSAQELNNELSDVFAEDQILRIDHFLGKEIVQNILAFRFANGIFEHLWNAQYIDHMQITLAETLGIAGRELFYDQTGVIRDVVQNHALQMMAVAMMDQPDSFQASDIRRARSTLLSATVCADDDQARERSSLGQYATGMVDGSVVPAYAQEHTELSASTAPTAVALRLDVDNDRWRGVPVYIRAGKRFARSVTEISVQFKEPVNDMFQGTGFRQQPNVLTFRIQPNEGIVLRIFVKEPGHGMRLDQVPMQFCYRNTYQMDLVEAYERLIHDASTGDATLFPHASEIQHSWAIIDPFVALAAKQTPLPYAAGSWGPGEFDALLKKDGRAWIEPSVDVCAI